LRRLQGRNKAGPVKVFFTVRLDAGDHSLSGQAAKFHRHFAIPEYLPQAIEQQTLPR
jgi:hypothetical protein